MQNISLIPNEISKSTINGLKHYKNGEYKEAVTCFQLAVDHWSTEIKAVPLQLIEARTEINKKLASSLFNLGSAKLELGKFTESWLCLIEVLEFEKDNEKYKRRYKKACLYFGFESAKLQRYLAASEQLLPPQTFNVWYRRNFITLSQAFLKNFKNFSQVVEQFTQTEKCPYQIVSLGCGWAEEVYMLLNLLGEELFEKIHYVGVDTSFNIPNEKGGRGDLLTNIYNKIARYKNIVFSGIDAQDAKAVAGLLTKHKADLIIVRHPEITSEEGRPVFANMLKNTIPVIAKENNKTSIFISTFFPNELIYASQYLVDSSTTPEKVDAYIQDLRNNPFSYIPEIDDAYNLEESIYHPGKGGNGIVEEDNNGLSRYWDQFSFLVSYPPQPKEDSKLNPVTPAKKMATRAPLKEATTNEGESKKPTIASGYSPRCFKPKPSIPPKHNILERTSVLDSIIRGANPSSS